MFTALAMCFLAAFKPASQVLEVDRFGYIHWLFALIGSDVLYYCQLCTSS